MSPSTPVMKIRVRVSTGDECPAGTAAFHTTFFAGPNSDGSPEVSAMPVPLGPRKRDQSGFGCGERESDDGEGDEFHHFDPMAHKNFVVRKYMCPLESAGELSV